jgi:isopenicillin N synthase-like dioxygenase
MDVAVVDYQASDAHAQFARSLKETGFAVIVNHPIAPKLIEQVQNEWLEYFTSAYDKRAYLQGKDGDGYFPPDVSETAKGANIKDLKEFFHIYPQWGQYPAEVAKTALDLFTQATDVAKTLLGWVERHTPEDVAKGYSMPLSHMVQGSSRTLLRILHYPPLRGDEPPGAVRAAAHEDINLITVLPAANEPGLQVKDSKGQWHDVPCDLGSLAINAGDMLQYASGGYFPSTTHRVVNPTGESAKRSRISMPLFLHPKDDVVLADGRTASSFLAERIAILRGERPSEAPQK